MISEFHTGIFPVLKASGYKSSIAAFPKKLSFLIGLYAKKAKGNIIFLTVVQPLPLLEPQRLECLSNLIVAEFFLREGKLTCLARLIPYGWS